MDDVIDASDDDEDEVSEYTDEILEEGEANAGDSRKQSVSVMVYLLNKFIH